VVGLKKASEATRWFCMLEVSQFPTWPYFLEIGDYFPLDFSPMLVGFWPPMTRTRTLAGVSAENRDFPGQKPLVMILSNSLGFFWQFTNGAVEVAISF